MNERNFRIETSVPNYQADEFRKELEKEKKLSDLNREYVRIMEEWDKEDLAGNKEVAEQLLEDANKIMKEMNLIDPQTEEDIEKAALLSKIEKNSMEDLKNQADELTKKKFIN